MMPYQPDATIIVIGDCSSEAQTLRLIVENLGCKTDFNPTGNPTDFLAALNSVPASCRVVIICAHGDANGLVFGEFFPEVDASLLIQGSLPARHLHLTPTAATGRIIFTTACETGTAAFARTFLDAGAAAFLAPADFPDGEDIVLFIHALLYQVLNRKRPLPRTWDRLNDAGLNTGLMILSRRLGPEKAEN